MKIFKVDKLGSMMRITEKIFDLAKEDYAISFSKRTLLDELKNNKESYTEEEIETMKEIIGEIATRNEETSSFLVDY